MRDWQASQEVDLITTSEKLRGLILVMTGERAQLSMPQKGKELYTKRRNDQYKPPYHHLVSDISQRAYDILMAHSPYYIHAQFDNLLPPLHPADPTLLLYN